MIYLQPRRKQHSAVSTPVQVGVALVLLCAGAAYIFPSFLQGALHTIAYPVWQQEASVLNVLNADQATLSRASLINENNILLNTIRSTEHLTARTQVLERENRELKKLLGGGAKNGTILATILSRPPIMAYDSLVLGSGMREQIAVGDRVFVADDVIIGEITAVYPLTSVVTLYSTPGRANEVRVGTSTLTAHGRGFGGFVIAVPRELIVDVGTPVSMPGNTPAVLGTIAYKESHPADPVEVLFVRSPYVLSEIDYVLVSAGPVQDDVVTGTEDDLSTPAIDAGTVEDSQVDGEVI